jgi:hypothetical protein
MPATDDQLVRAFYTAALYLIDKVEREGWYWTSNYSRARLRHHRIAFQQFTFSANSAQARQQVP